MMSDPYPESNSGYWEERADKAEAEVSRLRGLLWEVTHELGNHYCGAHEENTPYHAVDTDDPAQVCEGCRHTIYVYGLALLATIEAEQAEGDGER